jgi:hypothetical protein
VQWNCTVLLARATILTRKIALEAQQGGNAVQSPVVNIPEGAYVRVYGSWRGALVESPEALGPLQAFVIRAVTDHNEVGFWSLTDALPCF